jgi:SAV_6107-like HEPN
MAKAAAARRAAGLTTGPAADVHPVLRRAGAPPAALDLLSQAHEGLDEAPVLATPNERYSTAHLAALRTAAAVLAVRGRPETNERRRKRIRSAWEVLPEVAPELAEWAVFFAAGAQRRARADAGIQGAANTRDADDLIRAAGIFLRLVEKLLSLQPTLPARPPGGHDPEAVDQTPTPQAPTPQAPTSQTPAHPTPTPQPRTSQTSTPQARTPQTSTPQPRTPQTSTPQPRTPQTSTPQARTPQTSTPQTSTPRAPSPRASSPRASNPRMSSPRASAARGSDAQQMRIPTAG